MAILLLALACESPPAPPTDGERYTAILTDNNTELSALLPQCDTIEEPGLRADCALAVARRGAIQSEALAEALCPQVTEGMPRDECWSAAAEAAATRGSTGAASMCDRAGGLRSSCHFHLFQLILPGEAAALTAVDLPGAESRLTALIAEHHVSLAGAAESRLYRTWFVLVMKGWGQTRREDCARLQQRTACEEAAQRAWKELNR